MVINQLNIIDNDKDSDKSMYSIYVHVGEHLNDNDDYILRMSSSMYANKK